MIFFKQMEYHMQGSHIFVKIEGDAALDTAEEFLTALYLSEKIETIDDKASCDKTLDLISIKSGVSKRDMESYYRVAIEREIFNVGKRPWRPLFQ